MIDGRCEVAKYWDIPVAGEFFQGLFSIPGEHQHRCGTESAGGFEISQAVSDYDHLRRMYCKRFTRLDQQTRFGFPAITAVIRSVRTEKDSIQISPTLLQMTEHLSMYCIKGMPTEKPPGKTGLIAGDDYPFTSTIEGADRFQTTGNWHPLIGRLNEVLRVLIYYPVSI